MINLGRLDEFPVGKATVISIDSREVAIVRWREDELYAVHNRCPHMGGPLCRGGLGPKIVSRGGGVPGSIEVDEDIPTLVCPWHKWEFQAKNGESMWSPKYRVKTFPVTVENGDVILGMRRSSKGSRVSRAADAGA